MARQHEMRGGVLIVTSDKMRAPTPLTENPKVRLYMYLPPGSKCAFSEHAREPALQHPLPDRVEPSIWSPQKIRQVAADIRNRHYDAVRSMTVPHNWEDLYQYFHPIDLWYSGAHNLQLVAFQLLEENEICGWVEAWLTWEHNRYKLSLWNMNQDILSVFDSFDWSNIYDYGYTLPEDRFVFLRGELEYWYHHFHHNPLTAASNPPSTAATYVSPNIVAIAPPEDTLQPASQGNLGAPVALSPPDDQSSLAAGRSPIARTASASIQATAPEFIPSVRRSSSEHHKKPFASNPEASATNEPVKKTSKVQHQPSKSATIPETDVSKLQIETGIAGPSRLPSRVSQQMPVLSKPPATIAEVPPVENVVPAEPQVGSAKVDTQAHEQNTSRHGTSGRPSDQVPMVAQEQVQKKNGADQKPRNGWSHSRNDPIHGPIRQHNRQPQGNNNTSTYQRSNRYDRHTSAHRAAAGADIQCPNFRKHDPHGQVPWEQCGCDRCDRKNRSVRVRVGKEPLTPVKAQAIQEYLAQFGSIETLSKSAKYPNALIAIAVYRKEEGAVKAVKLGNGAKIYAGNTCLHLDLQHPWLSKHWLSHPQPREAEAGPPLNNGQPQRQERTPSGTSSQGAGHPGSGGSAQLHNGPHGSRHPSTPESDPFVGGNSRNYTNMLQHSHSSHRSQHPAHPPHLQHPHGYGPVPYGMPGHFTPAHPVPFHPPPHMPQTSPGHFVPVYGPPPPFGGGPPAMHPVMSPPHVPGPPRIHSMPPSFGFPPIHQQPSMQMIYTPWPEQTPHPPHLGFPPQYGHMPIHNGQPVGPPPGPPMGAPTGPRAEQMLVQRTNGIGHPDIEHHRGGVRGRTKRPAEIQQRELPSAGSSDSNGLHDIPAMPPPSHHTSEDIRLTQHRATAAQQGLNGEGHQAGFYQEGRGHHETHIDWGPGEVTGTVIRHKPAGRQALPSLWVADSPLTQVEASKGNPAPADVVPPTVELQETNKEQELLGNGKKKNNHGKKKKKENVTTQETSTQGASTQTAVGKMENLENTSQATEVSQPVPHLVTESQPVQTTQDEPKKGGKKMKKDTGTTQSKSSQPTEGELAPSNGATQGTKEESQPAPEVVAESNPTQASQDELKKAPKKKKKPAKRGPSVAEKAPEVALAPVENAPAEGDPVSSVPDESAPIESANVTEPTSTMDKIESIPTTTTTKRYRADAGGSLHIQRHRNKPSVRNIFVPPGGTDSISEDPAANNKDLRDCSSSTSTARPTNSPERQQQQQEAKWSKEQTRKKIHGSFGNLDVGFNPWPRAPSGEVWSPTKRPPPVVSSNPTMNRSTTPQPPPRVIVEPAPAVATSSNSGDTVTNSTEHAHGLPTPTRVGFKDMGLGLGEEIYAGRSTPGSNKKPSGSSFVSMTESQYTTASSYHSARSTLSSGEHSPPGGSGDTPPASP
ncbi:hypothetical protein B0T20DRAFT_501693 [Sordaria brevicollis]|uniref:Uncharacterized protein n=1 Tax=Sordaria brevicollis TaxID=83679 RepID=A0AAE0UA25_SORBR|nr:hypothetical protein B0T20DRAFT_501693 [Sordaria brevicollis]